MKSLPPLHPVKFPEANRNLIKPDDMTAEGCSSLYVHTDGLECISCWRVPFLVRLSILLFGRVWLCVMSGSTQPPVWLDGSRTVFRFSKGGK